jgi:hypothetical protein
MKAAKSRFPGPGRLDVVARQATGSVTGHQAAIAVMVVKVTSGRVGRIHGCQTGVGSVGDPVGELTVNGPAIAAVLRW